MRYASNILPSNAALYTLTNARIADGILELSSNGSANYSFTRDDISLLTSTFRLNLYTTNALDNYNPQVLVYISAKTATGYFNYTCTPSMSTDGIYYAEVQLETAEYEYFSIIFVANAAVSFSLWELCPEAAEDNISTIIEGVEQSLPKLLEDHNTFPFTIGQHEDTIALITCNLIKDTDLQGHLLLVYSTDKPCTLTLRFKDNDTTELFCPIVYNLSAGHGNIGVPHAYLNRLAGIHNIVITAQVDKGTVVVATRGLLFTIDGGYLAERLIDFGTDIRDISIKQTAADSSPSEIWAIGVENGEAVVRRRGYSQNTAGYEPVFIVGQVVEAAIEFNGIWMLRPGATSYTLETEDEPYVFYTDATGNLFAQPGNAYEKRELLDTGVGKISVCRGYMSRNHIGQDQGLICAYIKDGQVYYRTYAYNMANQHYIWDYAKLLDNVTNASFVNVHRLNDYRVGIVATTDTDNVWFISDRTYVSQSFKPETMSYGIERLAGFISVIPALSTFVFSCTGTSQDGTQIVLSCNAYIQSRIEDLKSAITLTGGAASDDILSVHISDQNIIIDLNTRATSGITVTVQPFTLRYKLSKAGWVFVSTLSVYVTIPTFTPEIFGLSMTDMTPTCNLIPILHNRVSTSDTIGMSLTNVSSVCTMVPIDRLPLNAPNETVLMSLNTAYGSVTMTLVGLLPI